jgi:transketolase
MGLAPLGYRLFARWLEHDPSEPTWPDRDRFVLSAGHASMLLYSLLHLSGYDLPMEQLRRFRQLESLTPGHPEYGLTAGVETTTGPLGQGFGNAVGMALAERLLAARFNRPGHDVVDHRTVVVASDGDLMEGVSAEAASLAGHLELHKLVVFWDDNEITIDGATDLAFAREDVLARFEAYGWRTVECADGLDLAAVDEAIETAFASDGRPTIVRVPTTIGYPAPTKSGTSKAHGAPLGADEIAATKEAMGWEYPPFVVPDEVSAHFDQRSRGQAARNAWQQRFDAYRTDHPDRATELERIWSGKLPDGWDSDLPVFETGSKTATRKTSERVLNAFAARVPEMIGGSADLAASNNTTIADGGDVGAKDFSGRNLHFGVREHAMAAIANGMALHQLRPFVGTFLTFSDYMRPSVRLAALSHIPSIFVFTHDSIGLGEDGPTHQPIEHLAALRAMPNLEVIRPADGSETVGAWRRALTRQDGPTALILTRQGLPELEGTDPDGVDHGAYRVAGPSDPQVVLAATGSEVSVAVDAAGILSDRGITASVVSMPCWEAVSDTSAVFPDGVPVLSVEAATSFGWQRFADAHVSIETFGVSAPASDAFAHFGFSPENVADAAQRLLSPSEE